MCNGSNGAPLFEKRRIIGSLRERTVYIPVNPNQSRYINDSQNGFYSNNPYRESNNNFYCDRNNINTILFDMEKRINEHIEKKIEIYENNIDDKIKKIDDEIREFERQQNSFEKRMRKMMKKIHKNKNHFELKRKSINQNYYHQIPKIETQSSIW